MTKNLKQSSKLYRKIKNLQIFLVENHIQLHVTRFGHLLITERQEGFGADMIDADTGEPVLVLPYPLPFKLVESE